LDLDRPAKPLLHLIGPIPAAALQALLAGTRARRQAAGIGGDAETHWIDEVRKLERSASRRR
jgi:hypothetical protein